MAPLRKSGNQRSCQFEWERPFDGATIARRGGRSFCALFFSSHWKRHRSHQKTSKTSKKCPPVGCEWGGGRPAAAASKTDAPRRISVIIIAAGRDDIFHFFVSPSFSRLHLFNCCQRVPPGGLGGSKVPPGGLEVQFRFFFQSCVFTCASTRNRYAPNHIFIFFPLKVKKK